MLLIVLLLLGLAILLIARLAGRMRWLRALAYAMNITLLFPLMLFAFFAYSFPAPDRDETTVWAYWPFALPPGRS